MKQGVTNECNSLIFNTLREWSHQDLNLGPPDYEKATELVFLMQKTQCYVFPNALQTSKEADYKHKYCVFDGLK